MRLRKLTQSKLSKASYQVTEHREQKEKTSLAKKDQFRKCLDNMVDGYSMLTAIRDNTGKITDFKYIYANDDACRNTGVSQGQFLKSTLLTIHPYFKTNGFFDKFCQTVETGIPIKRIPYRHINKRDLTMIRLFDINVIKIDDGIILNWRDVTEQERLKKILIQQENQYRTLVENIPSSICRLDKDLRYRYVSPSTAKSQGLKPEHYINKTWCEMNTHTSIPELQKQKIIEALNTAEVVEYEFQTPNEEGIDKHYHVRIVPEFDSCGHVETLLQISDDITEYKITNENLRQSQELIQKAFHNNNAIQCIISMTDGRYVEVNQRFTDVIEYTRDELIGRTPQELNLLVEDHSQTVLWRNQLQQNGEFQNLELPLRTKSGKILTVLVASTQLNFHGELCRITTGHDITKEKLLETEMQRLDRLNLVGEMAASIGHEIRNPMTTVRGYLQMFQRRLAFADYSEQLATMIDELDRANEIITEFLSLAKNKTIQRQPGNLNTLIDTMFPLIQADAFLKGHNVILDQGNIPDNAFDPQEIRQLLLNLTRNAMEAMKNNSIFIIRTYWDEDSIILEVHDTGSGIPSEILHEIGKPFVTTKENGTGLGLPVCYRIAERHDAKLKIESSPSGTIVGIHFKR